MTPVRSKGSRAHDAPTNRGHEARADREPEGMLEVCGRERQLVVRSRQRYDAIQHLLADGAAAPEITDLPAG